MKNFTKIIILIFSLVLLNSCGFTPMYKFQSINFYISKLNTNKENTTYHIFKEFMIPYLNKENKENSYDLTVDLEKSKKIISKDSNGNPLVYLMKIDAKISIETNRKLIVSKNYEKKFKYSHKSSIFDLNLYENEIERSLIKKITNQVISDISNLNKTNAISKNYKIKKIKINGNSKIGYGTSS